MEGQRSFFGAPRPGRLELAILVVLLLFAIILGVDTLIRSAFMSRPMTDAQVFFRAGWAVWADKPLYDVTDDNGWPYVYPPLFAVLMVPFANPPHGLAAPWFALSYSVSIVVLYVLEALSFVAAVHVAASAFEKSLKLSSPVADGRFKWHPWWFLRVAPLIAYLPLAAADIGRGQITSPILLILAGFGALLAGGRSFLAGFVLSLGVTLKLFPLIALGLPILRRDLACIAGFVVGLAVFAGLVPLLALGWSDFLSAWAGFEQVAIGISSSAGNSSGAAGASMTPDAVGIGAAIYKTWAVLAGGEIDRHGPRWVILVHLGTVVAMLAAFTVLSWRRSWTLIGPQPRDPMAVLLSVALLAAVSAVAPPVAQLNYLMLGTFLHMALIALAWERRGEPVTPLWLYGLGGFVWIAAILNMSESLGRVAWLTTGVWPILASIAIGLVQLARRTGRNVPAGL